MRFRRVLIVVSLLVVLFSVSQVGTSSQVGAASVYIDTMDLRKEQSFQVAEDIGAVLYTEHGSKTFLGENRWRYRSSVGETNTWNGSHYLRYVYDLDNKQVSIGRLTFTHGPNGVISVSHSGSGSMIGELKWYAQYYFNDQWQNFTFDNYEYLGATKTDDNATVYQRWWSTNGELNVSYTYYYWNELKMRAQATNWAAQTVPVRVLWAMTDIKLTGVEYSLIYEDGVAVGVQIGNEQQIFWHDVTENAPEININPILDKENRRAAVVFGNMSSVLAQYETMDIDPTYNLASDSEDAYADYWGGGFTLTTGFTIIYIKYVSPITKDYHGFFRFDLDFEAGEIISADLYGYETADAGTNDHKVWRVAGTDWTTAPEDLSARPTLDETGYEDWSSNGVASQWININVTDLVIDFWNEAGTPTDGNIGFELNRTTNSIDDYAWEDYQHASSNHAYLEIDFIGPTEDFVDQISDLHDPSDMGTHSDFAEMQDKDGTYDTLTEADIVEIPSEWKYVDGLSAAETVWTTVGASPYLDVQDEPTNYIYTSSNGAISSWYTLADTSGYSSGSNSFTVNASVYWKASSGDSYAQWEVDWTSDDTADASGSFTTKTVWGWDNTGTLSGLDTVSEINQARIRFTHNKGAGGPEQVNVDAARIGIAETGTNYELDLEVGWIAADYDETSEELCIFGGTQGSEALRVDVWDGSWTNVFTDIAVGWNNISVTSYLTDATFEIRFTDTTNESVEADTWQVEAVLLHTWSAVGNEYQEYVFETIPFSDTITTIADFSTTVNELIGIFETVVVSASLHLQILEQIIFSDTASLVVGYLISIFEILGLAAIVSTATAAKVVSFETIGLAAVTTVNAAFQYGVSETIGLFSISSPSASISLTVFELIGLAESVMTEQGIQILIFETIGIISVVTISASFSTTVNETVGLFSTSIPASSVHLTVFETIPIFESVQVSRSASIVIMETIGLTSVVVVSAGYSNTVTELIGIVETTQPAASISITRYEVIGLFESVVTNVSGVNQFFVTIYEVIGASESVTASMSASVTLLETIGFTDIVIASATYPITIFENILMSSSTATSQLTHYNVYEVIGIISSTGIVGGVVVTPTTGSMFYQLFFSLEMWGYLGPIALVIGGYVVTNKEKILGVLWFVVECLFISHYLTLVSATPDYWWHVFILLIGGMLTIVYSFWDRS